MIVFMEPIKYMYWLEIRSLAIIMMLAKGLGVPDRAEVGLATDRQRCRRVPRTRGDEPGKLRASFYV